jgi:hypothetical protein
MGTLHEVSILSSASRSCQLAAADLLRRASGRHRPRARSLRHSCDTAYLRKPTGIRHRAAQSFTSGAVLVAIFLRSRDRLSRAPGHCVDLPG